MANLVWFNYFSLLLLSWMPKINFIASIVINLANSSKVKGGTYIHLQASNKYIEKKTESNSNCRWMGAEHNGISAGEYHWINLLTLADAQINLFCKKKYILRSTTLQFDQPQKLIQLHERVNISIVNHIST